MFSFKNASVVLIIHYFPTNIFVLSILGYEGEVVGGLMKAGLSAGLKAGKKLSSAKKKRRDDSSDDSSDSDDGMKGALKGGLKAGLKIGMISLLQSHQSMRNITVLKY